MTIINNEIHNIHDKTYKDLLGDKKVFLDMLKSYINKPWCDKISKDNLTLIDKSFILSDYEYRESDILYKAKIDDKEVYFYILLELQSTVDHSMPIRLFLYMAEIYRNHLKNFKENEVKKVEFKLPAIIPIVLYNGEVSWPKDRNFRNKVYDEEMFGDNIIDFNYNLIDVNSYDEEELVKVGDLISAIFLLDQNIDVLEFVNRLKEIAERFKNISKDDIRKLNAWIRKTTKDNLELDKILKVDGGVDLNMTSAISRNLEKLADESRMEGKLKILIKQLTKKFKELPEKYINSLSQCTDKTLDKIAEDIFDINSLEDLDKYF